MSAPLDDANCAATDPRVFYDWAWVEGVPQPGLALALDHCRDCPVRELCLSAGLHEDEGVWGGTVPPERKAMR